MVCVAVTVAEATATLTFALLALYDVYLPCGLINLLNLCGVDLFYKT